MQNTLKICVSHTHKLSLSHLYQRTHIHTHSPFLASAGSASITLPMGSPVKKIWFFIFIYFILLASAGSASVTLPMRSSVQKIWLFVYDFQKIWLFVYDFHKYFHYFKRCQRDRYWLPYHMSILLYFYFFIIFFIKRDRYWLPYHIWVFYYVHTYTLTHTHTVVRRIGGDHRIIYAHV